MQIMKVLCVILLLLISELPANAKIRNGYEKDIDEVFYQTEIMEGLINGEIIDNNGSWEWENLSNSQKRVVKQKLQSLQELIKYYVLTDLLVNNFKEICSDIYAEIDSIKNADQIPTDVYIKVVSPKHELRALSGVTILSCDSVNQNTCISEFGKHSVLIQVCAIRSVMKILAHELGHAKFAIPNLADYVDYCKRRYNHDSSSILTFNHQATDLGMACVIDYERKFREAYREYKKRQNTVVFHPAKILKEMDQSLNWKLFRQELVAESPARQN